MNHAICTIRKAWWIAAILCVAALPIGWTALKLAQPETVRLEGKFELHLYQWGYGRGQDLLAIHSDGNAEVMSRPQGVKGFHKRFVVDEKRLADLVAKINTLRVFNMKDIYNNVKAEDGEVWYFVLQTDKQIKTIYCPNDFPSQIITLKTFLDDTILTPLAGPIAGEPISDKVFFDRSMAVRQKVRTK